MCSFLTAYSDPSPRKGISLPTYRGTASNPKPNNTEARATECTVEMARFVTGRSLRETPWDRTGQLGIAGFSKRGHSEPTPTPCIQTMHPDQLVRGFLYSFKPQCRWRRLRRRPAGGVPSRDEIVPVRHDWGMTEERCSGADV
jgi:hypothetical protein